MMLYMRYERAYNLEQHAKWRIASAIRHLFFKISITMHAIHPIITAFFLAWVYAILYILKTHSNSYFLHFFMFCSKFMALYNIFHIPDPIFQILGGIILDFLNLYGSFNTIIFYIPILYKYFHIACSFFIQNGSGISLFCHGASHPNLLWSITKKRS